MSKPPPSGVFTLRDLNRQPAKVLDGVRKFGSAEIRTRSGEVFTVAPKADEELPTREFPIFKARWKKLRDSCHLRGPRTRGSTGSSRTTNDDLCRQDKETGDARQPEDTMKVVGHALSEKAFGLAIGDALGAVESDSNAGKIRDVTGDAANSSDDPTSALIRSHCLPLRFGSITKTKRRE